MQYRPAQIISIRAGANLSAHRFVTASGNVPAAGASTLGVTLSAAQAGDQTPIVTLGTAVVEAAAAIAVGDPIATDAAGQAVVHTSGNKVAVALTSGRSGDLVEVFLIPNA